MKTQAIKDKLKATFQTKYGVETASQIPGSEEKKIKTCLQRYGVEYTMQNNVIDQKRRQTCMEKYGTDTVLNTVIAREKNRSPETQKKKHETMKRNGTYGSSKPEEACYVALCEKFGVFNVERQVTVHKWPIDFYVRSIDTYVQLDGIYWHGLDRPINEIAGGGSPRDAQIHKKWLTDREQDAWCEAHNLRLIRIKETDALSDLEWLVRDHRPTLCS